MASLYEALPLPLLFGVVGRFRDRSRHCYLAYSSDLWCA